MASHILRITGMAPHFVSPSCRSGGDGEGGERIAAGGVDEKPVSFDYFEVWELHDQECGTSIETHLIAIIRFELMRVTD